MATFTEKLLASPEDVKKLKIALAAAFSTDSVRASAIADSAANYKVYTINATQTGTAAPTATVLDNTLPQGTPVLARTGAGVYTITLAGAFTSGKTVLITGTCPTAGATVSAVRTSADVITVTTSNASNAAADVLLADTLIEIRVYN